MELNVFLFVAGYLLGWLLSRWMHSESPPTQQIEAIHADIDAEIIKLDQVAEWKRGNPARPHDARQTALGGGLLPPVTASAPEQFPLNTEAAK